MNRHARLIANFPGPAAALLALVVLIGCADTQVDPDTAHYTLGDDTDTSTTFDLQKAFVGAGFITPDGNTEIADFVDFTHRTRYRVDSLADGMVTGINNLQLSATFGDPNAPARRHRFYPLSELEVVVPSLKADGPRPGPILALGNPNAAFNSAGLRAVFFADGIENSMRTQTEDVRNFGSAYITFVDKEQRTIGLRVSATMNDVTDSAFGRAPIINAFGVEIELHLRY